jgi:hypothetical protein
MYLSAVRNFEDRAQRGSSQRDSAPDLAFSAPASLILRSPSYCAVAKKPQARPSAPRRGCPYRAVPLPRRASLRFLRKAHWGSRAFSAAVGESQTPSGQTGACYRSHMSRRVPALRSVVLPNGSFLALNFLVPSLYSVWPSRSLWIISSEI